MMDLLFTRDGDATIDNLCWTVTSRKLIIPLYVHGFHGEGSFALELKTMRIIKSHPP